jgi:bifunctional DNase/RNase
MEVEVKIRGLMLDPNTNQPIVVLQDLAGDRVIPIWIGGAEAQAIAFELEKHVPPRPQTHDLMRNLVIGLNASLCKIVVTELKDDSFYAVLWFDRQGQIISLDSRPSDAFALALRLDCPMFVDESVLKSSSISSQDRNAQTREMLERFSDEDFGPHKM